jgi:hypothetical protein
MIAQVRQSAWRVAPLLFLIVLYWPGLTNWFYQDDFGWLNLHRDVHSFRDLGLALFAPKAHGNMRPLSDSGYFLLFGALFGVNALPFRIWAFALQMASLVLLGSVVRRLTSSATAGFWSQILWISNCALATVMSWTSVYNQILSGFFFLLGFYFLLRHIETGQRRYEIAHGTAFVLGLGALETNVVYPAVAAAYTLLFARPFLKKVLPMFLISALAILVHFRFAPPPHDGPYAIHINPGIFSTLWTYWTWALGAPRLAVIRPIPSWLVVLIVAALSVAAVAAIASSARRHEYVGLFAIAWFVIVLGPYLPLSDHLMDYYLASPVIGVAILGAWAIASAWRSGFAWRICAMLCIGAYLGTSLPAARAITRWHHDRGVRVEDLVLGVAEIHQADPNKIILLDGIDTDLFWSGIVDVPFRVMEIPHVYLVPGSESHIQAPPGLVTKYALPQALSLRALNDGRAVVYRADGPVLKNVTSRYRALADAHWKLEPPRFLNLADSLYSEYLGPGWNKIAGGYRSMSGVGTIHIGGPRGQQQRLYVGIFCTRDFRIGVRIDGVEIPAELIRRDYELSEFGAALPSSLIGKDAVDVSLRSDAPEPLNFGFAEIR